VMQFADEQLAAGSTTYVHALGTGMTTLTSIGSFASITTLDLRLVGDASTGVVCAYYAVNSGAFVKLSKTLTLSGTIKSSFFNTAGRAGIIALSKNDLPPETMTFDSFAIDPGTNVNARPSMTATRP